MKHMKRLLLSLFLLPLLSLQAQVAHKYPLLEHFTNTRCSICPTPNASLYNYIDQHPQAFHHISYHPSVPYINCFLYQSNTVGNQVRQTDYNVAFTPQSYLNGRRSFTSSSLINLDSLAANSELTAALRIELDLRLSDAIPKVIALIDKFDPGLNEGNKLFVALVEEPVNYAGPNGESVHHNVFRAWLTPEDGSTLNFGAAKQVFWTENFNPDPSWDLTKLFAIAFVQSNTSVAILNSGASYDVKATVSVGAGSAQVDATGGIPPYTYSWSDGQQGQAVTGLAAGNYVVRVTDSVGNYYEMAFTNTGSTAIDPLADQSNVRWYFDADAQVLNLLALSESAESLDLQLVDLAGRVIETTSWDISAKTLAWKLAELAPGVYVVKLTGAHSHEAFKWTKR